jgi:hypothetical protein
MRFTFIILVIVLCVSLAALGIVFVNYLFPLKKALRYIPTVKVAVSLDNGKTYKEENIKIISTGLPFYVKFTLSIKAQGRLWSMGNNIVPVWIEHPETLELDDFVGQKGDTPDETATRSCFYLSASAHPKQTEIVFYCENNESTDIFQFKVDFKGQVDKVYTRTVTLRTYQYGVEYSRHDR